MKKYIVSPGRSVGTAKRGMAHEGGIITARDLSHVDPESVLKGWLKSGKVLNYEAPNMDDPAVVSVSQGYLNGIAVATDGEGLEAIAGSIAEKLSGEDVMTALEAYATKVLDLDLDAEYAIMKEGRDSALRVLDDESQAREYLEGLGSTEGIYVLPRIGE